MSLSEATFALLQPPSFDVVPDTDVILGSVHPVTKTSPRRPDTKRVLNRNNVVPVPTDLYRYRKDHILNLDEKQLQSKGGGIKLHLPFLQGVGGDASAERSNDKTLYIDARNVETHFFIPNDAYFKEILKNDVIRESLSNVWRPYIFLVTGVKIAESATIVTGKKKNTSGEVGPEIDLTAFGIPVDVGASIKTKRDDHHVMAIQKTKFVLAFETWRIKVKKEAYSEQLFRDFAMLDDEQEDHNDLSENLREIFSFDKVTIELDDE